MRIRRIIDVKHLAECLVHSTTLITEVVIIIIIIVKIFGLLFESVFGNK